MAAVTSAVVAGVGLTASLVESADSSRQKKRAARARASIVKLENARSRRQQIRDARIQQGTVLARAATSGAGFGGLASSSARGQSGGLRSQLRSNLQFIDDAGRHNEIASRSEIKANRADSNAHAFSSVGNFALTAGQLFG